MKHNKKYTLQDAIKMYYGENSLSEEDTEKIDEALKKMNNSDLKGKCQKIVSRKEKKIWQIGRLHISKAACFVTLICLLVAVSGFTLVRAYIKMLRVKDIGNCAVVEYISGKITYGDYPEVIEEYFDPVWIPEGYELSETVKRDIYYRTEYSNKKGGYINYKQGILYLNPHFSAEKGIHEDVEFGKYSGEFIVAERSNFLIVTDGVYLYSLMAYGSEIDKDTMIKMIIGE